MSEIKNDGAAETPGVTWDDLVSLIEKLKEDAARPRLAAVKMSSQTMTTLRTQHKPGVWASLLSLPIHADESLPLGMARCFDQYGQEMNLP